MSLVIYKELEEGSRVFIKSEALRALPETPDEVITVLGEDLTGAWGYENKEHRMNGYKSQSADELGNNPALIKSYVNALGEFFDCFLREKNSKSDDLVVSSEK